MVQDQLVEYISSQLKAGVSADSVKAALVGAGWQAVDVDDTMKNVQSPAGAASASPAEAKPASASPASSSSPFPQSSVQPKAQTAGPQVIRVSDLVSASPDPKPMSFAAAPSEKPSVAASTISSAKTDAVMSKIAAGARPAGAIKPTSMSMPASASMSPSGMAAGSARKSHSLAVESVLGILMVLFAAAALFMFFENRTLSAQVASVDGQSSGVSSQLSALQAQFQASTTALAAQMASTTAANTDLLLDLSFYAVPPGAPATTTPTSALKGTVLGGGKYQYFITTMYGAKVYVANSKDPRVVALLQPLIGGTSIAMFSGDYVPGADTITITAVNGTPVVAPAVPASTTSASAPASSGTATGGTTNVPMIPASTTGK